MLVQLKLQAGLKRCKSELSALETSRAGFEERQAVLEKALNEAVTDEDVKLVEGQIEELEQAVTETGIDEKVVKVTAEITRIEDELADVAERAKSEQQAGNKSKLTEKRGSQMNELQVRELLKTGEYFERSEVKEFYEKFKNLRATGSEGMTIPQIIIDRIMDIVGDYSTLYPLVNQIKAKGTTRILIDTDTSAATWIEQSGTIPTGDVFGIDAVDFDGFKIGKGTFIDNSMLQDSVINVDEYVTKKLARAIALGLDLAILKGEGSAKKQPEGILPALDESHKVSVVGDKLVNLVTPIGLIDTGEDTVGEITVVVSRTTYYNRLLGFSINTNSDGDVVGKLPNLKSPDLLGLRVVFNNNMNTNTILYGDFEKYTLVDREDIAVDNSEHVKFLEDKMTYRGKGRFDGKPTNKKAFVLVTIADPTTPPAGE